MSALPNSLWAATAPPAPPCPALRSEEEAEVAIVGAGYTGLSAALHLVEAGKEVRVLDAGEPGWGCSGRNGGQVNPGGTRELPRDVIARLGPERGESMVRMGDATCDLVFDLIARHRIECDALRPGFVQGAHGRRGRVWLESWARQWGAFGAEVELLERGRTEELIGSAGYDHALLDPRGGNLQPLSYARGLARAAMAAGARIHGASRATGIVREGAQWRVATAEGGVRAPVLLLCTNGYTDGLWPGLRRTVVPVCSFVAATEPLGHNALRTVLPGRHAVSEAGRVIVYYRLDRDGRFVIGGRGNYFDLNESGDDAHVRKRAVELFPLLAGIEWRYRWSGYPAMTTDHLPRLLRVADGVYAGLGYNGRGVGTATMMGKQLALAVMGDATDIRVEPMQSIAMHSFRQAGVSCRLLSGSLLDWWERRETRARSAKRGSRVSP